MELRQDYLIYQFHIKLEKLEHIQQRVISNTKDQYKQDKKKKEI
jgi:hypothetical protein